MTILETDRLIIRTFEPGDLDSLSEIFADPDCMRYSFRHLKPKEEVIRVIQYLADYHVQHGYSMWATVLKADNRLIGHCGLMSATINGVEEVEVGFIFAKAHWGRGLATEAACAIRDHGFYNLGMSRLVSMIDPDNITSQQVAVKIGMNHERDFIDGNGHPCQLYMMTKSECT
jgi:ribosomal-protein-alanine N-acetyltransferase